MAKTVGKRSVKPKKPVQQKKEVSLFNFEDDFGNFQDPFDDGTFIPKSRNSAQQPQKKSRQRRSLDPANTTRALTGVAVGVTMASIIPSLVSRL